VSYIAQMRLEQRNSKSLKLDSSLITLKQIVTTRNGVFDYKKLELDLYRTSEVGNTQA
jgi:hypothetical protein